MLLSPELTIKAVIDTMRSNLNAENGSDATTHLSFLTSMDSNSVSNTNSNSNNIIINGLNNMENPLENNNSNTNAANEQVTINSSPSALQSVTTEQEEQGERVENRNNNDSDPTIETAGSHSSSTLSHSSLSLRYSQICASVTSLLSSNSNSNSTPTSQKSNSSSDLNCDSSLSSITHSDIDTSINTTINTRISASTNPTTTNNDYQEKNANSTSEDLHQQTIHDSNTNPNSKNVTSEKSPTSLSSAVSVASISSVSVSSQETNDDNIPRHELQSFLNVGRNLMQNHHLQQTSSHSTIDTTNSVHADIPYDTDASGYNHESECSPERFHHSSWCNNLNEHDMEDFKVVDQVLMAVEPNLYNSLEVDNHKQLKLDSYSSPIIEPPQLNEQEIKKYCCSNRRTENGGKVLSESKQQEIASLLLPEEFTCSLCKDLIVGAVILDCGCCQSTYCISCLERFKKRKTSEGDNDGFVVVDWKDVCTSGRNDQCPSCNKGYNQAIPCHTINVAVLNAVRNLNLTMDHKNHISSHDIDNFISNYCKRLEIWREEFYRRQKSKLDMKKQLFLSKMISEQEALMNEFKREKETKKKYNLNAGDIPLAVAALVGINFILFRKWSIY